MCSLAASGQVARDLAIGQTGAQDGKLHVHDLLDVGQREWLEEGCVIDAV
jgi:hypothetical protein